MATKELVLINPGFGTRDNLPAEFDKRTFSHVATWLKKKYAEQIVDLQREKNGEPLVERSAIHFTYSDRKGAQIVVDLSETVGAIKKLTDSVTWVAEPVGASDIESFRQVFGNHANEIVHHPKYQNWKPIHRGQPGRGIEAIGPDPRGITRTWLIEPTPDYPWAPPRVTAQPAYTEDPCWTTGELNCNVVAWEEALARGVGNPLHYLMTEFAQKYHLGM